MSALTAVAASTATNSHDPILRIGERPDSALFESAPWAELVPVPKRNATDENAPAPTPPGISHPEPGTAEDLVMLLQGEILEWWNELHAGEEVPISAPTWVNTDQGAAVCRHVFQVFWAIGWYISRGPGDTLCIALRPVGC